MAKIKNLRELNLMKQKLQVKEKLYEKELVASTAFLVDHLTDKLRDLTFEFGMRITSHLISRIFRKKHKRKKEKEANENENEE